MTSPGWSNLIAPDLRTGMLEGVGTDQPDHESYRRVTNPGRYQTVVDAADVLISDLVNDHQVELTAGNPSVDFPDWAGGAERVVRVRPNQGAPLAFMFTEFLASWSALVTGVLKHSRYAVAMHARSLQTRWSRN